MQIKRMEEVNRDNKVNFLKYKKRRDIKEEKRERKRSSEKRKVVHCKGTFKEQNTFKEVS